MIDPLVLLGCFAPCEFRTPCAALTLPRAKHVHDLAERIPRAEVTAIYSAVRAALRAVMRRSGVPSADVEAAATAVACGSYRRGAPDSSDVDVLVMRHDGGPDGTLLHDLLRELKTDGRCEMEHMVHAAAAGEAAGSEAAGGEAAGGEATRGEAVTGGGASGGAGWRSYSGVIRLPGFARFRRLDLKLFPPEQFPYAMLHFTSGRDFNIAMRTHANARGYKLSETALRPILSKQRHQEPVCGAAVRVRSEQEVFAHLGLVYQPPEERGAQVTPVDALLLEQ